MQIFNTLLARAIPWLPRAAIHQISHRYIAGDTLTDVLARVRQLNSEGFLVALDVLGETVSTLQQAEATAAEYIDVLEAIAADGLLATASIKPSALGLLRDMAHSERLARRILASARQNENGVCIDMEDVRCTQLEIDLLLRLQSDHDNVGLAFQAYLQRTYQDIEMLTLGHDLAHLQRHLCGRTFPSSRPCLARPARHQCPLPESCGAPVRRWHLRRHRHSLRRADRASDRPGQQQGERPHALQVSVAAGRMRAVARPVA